MSQIPASPNFSANRGHNSLNPRHDALRNTIALLISALVDFAVTYRHLHGIQGFSEMVHVQVLKLCCRQRERVKPDRPNRSQLLGPWLSRVVLRGERTTQLPTPRWTVYVFLFLLTATFLNKPSRLNRSTLPNTEHGSALGISIVNVPSRSELRPHLPKLRRAVSRNRRPRTSHQVNEHGNTQLRTKYRGGYLKDARFLGRRPELLVPLPSRVGRNLTATRRCGSTTPANPSDGRSGYSTALLLENSRETSTEKRQKREEKEGAHNRKTSPTPLPRELERDARGLKKQSGQSWVTRHSGLLALWPSGCGTGSCLLRHGTSR